MHFIGIDFGTSNSLGALFKDDKAQFVNFPDHNISNPTILYLPAKSKQHYIGNEAVQQYLTDLEESGSGGRLMLSIKSLLPEAAFDYTMVFGHGRQSAEDLVAKFLSELKRMAEQQFAQTFDGVVLGRPVDFSELAVSRLEKAARSVGFKEVVFWLEPVAAALAYEITSTQDELVCVVDLGGGTSDICVIETSPSRSLLADRLSDIKSVGGINQAGDELSTQIMKHRLAPRFGAGSTYKSLDKVLPFPAHIIYKLSKWHRINLLNDPQEKSIILSIYPSSDHPEDLDRLLSLINNHYGFELFQAIDTAKRNLSISERATINFNKLDLHEDITLEQFERLIAPVTHMIEKSIIDALAAASVKPKDIKRVVLTGGTSQVPLINESVIKIFGAKKILRPDFFSSVATGLGYVASSYGKRRSKSSGSTGA